MATARAELPALPGVEERLRLTVSLLEERGYALPPERIGELCWGGAVSVPVVLAAVAADPGLELAEGLVVSRHYAGRAAAIGRRASGHGAAAAAYLPDALRFVDRLLAVAPYVVCAAIAGSLASGGFAESDDVDLNLVVEDGHRHLAYVVLNLLGLLDALHRRGKPVDASTRRPLAPRVMTANLVLERSQCFPLARTDAQMALELLQSQAVHGAGFLAAVVAANPELAGHFPQLAGRRAPAQRPVSRRLPARLFPRWLDAPARLLGEAAWRWMMWTRRRSPEALDRVAYVRATMRPYALFSPRPGASR